MKGFAILLSLTFLASFNLKAQTKLKIYGGKSHDQYLGCLDCATDDLKSVWCIFGDYGSTHSAKSIWNEIGLYGSKSSNYSPFNKKAKYPPLILDENGKSHGYLTINKNNPNPRIQLQIQFANIGIGLLKMSQNSITKYCARSIEPSPRLQLNALLSHKLTAWVCI